MYLLLSVQRINDLNVIVELLQSIYINAANRP